MKKQNYICIAAVMALATFGSCKKDFLIQSPEASLTGQNFYKTESQIRDAVNGAYNSLQIMGSNSIFANAPLAGGYWQFGELRSDNTTFQYNPNGRGDEQVWFIDKFMLSSTFEPIKNYWQQNYRAIFRDNDVLEHIDAVSMDNAKKNQYTGEAKFLRAFNYFNLVRQFGGVPLRIKATESPEGAKSGGRATEEAVYTQIIADLTDAAAKLPAKYTGADIGRATQGAARTLLAKVYMTQKKFNEALTELRKVETLGYSLQTNYINIFSPSNKNNSESIFEIQYVGSRTDMSSYFTYEFAPIDSRNKVIPDPALANNDGGVGMNIPTPELLEAYSAGDLRKDASIGMLTYQPFGTTVTVPYVKKYNWGIITSRHTDVNFPVLRYADVLLMIAECLNETGNSAEALTYLNMVHAHSRTGLSSLATTGQTQLRDLIMKERQVELAFENHRWYDLVRWGKAVEVMTAHGARQKAERPTTEVEPNAYQITPQKLLLPIPEIDITLDNLQQNPGY
jgi:starch-binding outer membrane protein, SusD/RagB family